MKEKIPVMNVHKPPSIEVPPKIVDFSTSLINSFDPGRGTRRRSGEMKILRDERFSPEMGGLESGYTLSILKMYES